MGHRPKVSVVVPHYRDLPALELCLRSLDLQTYPRDRYEIIVADNGSWDDVTPVAEVIAGRARLVTVLEQGAGPARNGGVAVSNGEILAFIDCDCSAEPDWLTAGVHALDSYDFVGGRMTVSVEDPANMTGPEAFETVFAFNNEDYVLRKGFTVTANLLCPRAVFDTVGGFRVGVSEDYDWCRRASEAGYRIGYARDAGVSHPARRSWSDLEKKWRRLNSETYAVFAERRWGRARWFLKAFALPLSAVAHTPRVLLHPKLGMWRHRFAALSVLYRLRAWRAINGLRLVLAKPPA